MNWTTFAKVVRLFSIGWLSTLALLSAILLSISPAVVAQLSDELVHTPPTAGTYDYNTFSPSAPGFPSKGNAYVDPIFGTAIRRMTDTVGGFLDDNIYAFHRSNANGTFIFAELSGGLAILDVSNGETRYSGQPTGLTGFEIYWDALDPDKYYYLDGSRLVRRNLAAQTNTIMKEFGTNLQTNGGSLNVQSAGGRYFTVRYGGTNKLWDSQLDVIYSGSVTPDGGDGWVSITPNASHFVTAANSQTSYVIDHSTQSISSNGVMFWNLCGDHGVLLSASDGKSYFVGAECYDVAAIYRIDLTIDQSGASPQRQRDDNLQLIDLEFSDDVHLSGVSKGVNRDWAFISTENLAGNDNFDAEPTGWTPFRSEIIAVNIISGQVRRLAHHRSRSIPNSYYYQPRVSSSWDGSVVMWASNMNTNSSNYNDLYVIESPLESVSSTRPIAIADLAVLE